MPISPQEFEGRMRQVQKSMHDADLQALIAYSDNRITGNVRYLSNFSLRYAGYQSVGPSNWVIYGNAIVVIPPDGEAALITDCDFAASVVDEMCVLNRKIFSMDLAGTIPKLLGQSRGRVGITTWDKVPHTLVAGLSKRLPQVQLVPTTIVEELRMIKSPAEISIMREAAKVIDEAMAAAVGTLKEGVTEKEVCLAATHVMETRNPSPQFVPPTQVAMFGKRTSTVGYPSQARLQHGDVAVLDLNSEYDGYVSDITRVKVFGAPPTKEQKDVYSVSLEMYKKAVDAIKPGVKARAMWDAAEKVAVENGYGKYIRPLVSHGLGLDIQERPSTGVDETILSPGMVLTCEPELCLENFGMYTEDSILVTDSGHETLTKYEKVLE